LILTQPYPPVSRGKLVVWGLMASLPVGGMVWQVFHNLVPLRRLGFDVWYVEDSDRLMYDMTEFAPHTQAPPENLALLARYMGEIGLGDRWAFRMPGTETVIGATDAAGLKRLYAESVAALNLCGAQELSERHMDIAHRIYLQTDPVGMQVQVAHGDAKLIAILDRHQHYFTYGANLGRDDCPVPMDPRHPWHPTVPPVCLDLWGEGAPPPAGAKLSTILNWKHDDRDVEWNGQLWHWSKDREFRRFFDIPSRSRVPLELCLGGATRAEIAEIASHGWGVKPSTDYMEPHAYRDFIVGSFGEFSAAKEMVTVTRSGWVSDRTVCYLAAGRPAIVQDTGLATFLPVGEGLFTFDTNEQALAAIEAVAGDYARHSRAAREIAREYFDGERVLGKVMRDVGLL
jgi:hypothetical protein